MGTFAFSDYITENKKKESLSIFMSSEMGCIITNGTVHTVITHRCRQVRTDPHAYFLLSLVRSY